MPCAPHADTYLPPDHDPTKPLPKRDEHFCRMIAAGVSLAKAVENAFSGVKKYKNDDTRRQRGFKLVRLPAFKARIHHLRTLEEIPDYLPAETTKPKQALDRSRNGLIILMSEITHALAESIRALDGAGAEPKETVRLRADLLLHVRRLDKLRPAEEIALNSHDRGFARLLAWASGVECCTCSQIDPNAAGVSQ